MARIKTDAYQCERCGHIWLPRNLEGEPRVCPKCKSPYWNTPRQIERKTKQQDGTKKTKRRE